MKIELTKQELELIFDILNESVLEQPTEKAMKELVAVLAKLSMYINLRNSVNK